MKKTAVVVGAVLGATLVITNVVVLKKLVDIDEKVEKLQDEVDTIKEVQVNLVQTKHKLNLSKADYDCLVKNIYHEAGVEDTVGKIAVAQVTYNRMKDGKWGKSICKVVHSKAQFSWTLSKKKVAEKPKGDLWRASVQAANDFVHGLRSPELEESKFYHATYVSPNWADPSKKIATVGRHIFYTTASQKT